MGPIESLAAAIQFHEGWSPTSRSWRNNNPGNLRGSMLVHSYDADGYCVFPAFAIGWEALIHDLVAKVSGNNTHGLGPASSLLDLFKVYAPEADGNNTLAYADHVAEVLTVALRQPVTRDTKLSIFGGG